MKVTKELKLGVFVVSVLVASFFVINYLRGEDVFNREIELYSIYDNVEGVVPSSPVFIKGFKAGKVNEVVYQPETGDFRVVCSVKRDFAIPEDSRMIVYSMDIMGTKAIRIDAGISEVPAQDMACLASSFESGLVDGLAAGISPLMAKLEMTLDSLAVTVSSVNGMLSSENRAAISATISHLEKTTSDVASLSRMINGRSSELNSFITDLSAFSAKLGAVAEGADSALVGVNKMVGTINESDISGVVSSLHTLLKNVNDTDGTIGKLFVDNSVYNSVDSLLNNIDSLVQKIQENPKKYIKISIF